MYKYIIQIVAIIAFVLFIYHRGYSSGSDKVLAQWQEEKLKTEQTINNLKEQYHEQELIYTESTHRLLLELKNKEEAHKVELASLTSSFNDKLLESEQRSSIYKHLSETSKDKCRVLADHTARLDRQLTEGIRLVKELRTVIELRDTQLRTLNEQLILMEKAYE